MNVKKLIRLWNIISTASVLLVPVVWVGLNYFDLLLVKFWGFTLYTWLYIISWYAVVFVMAIRPLADLFPKYKFLRQLCLLRRCFWILSAMIIVTFLLDKWITNPASLQAFFSFQDWSWKNPLIARLSELTAIVLLITSNNFSQRKLWKNWKRVQRVSYIYFITGWVLAMRYGDEYGVFVSMMGVMLLFVMAAAKKSKKLWIF